MHEALSGLEHIGRDGAVIQVVRQPAQSTKTKCMSPPAKRLCAAQRCRLPCTDWQPFTERDIPSLGGREAKKVHRAGVAWHGGWHTHRLLTPSALQPIPTREGIECSSAQPFKYTEGSSSAMSKATSSITVGFSIANPPEVPEVPEPEVPEPPPCAAITVTSSEATVGRGIDGTAADGDLGTVIDVAELAHKEWVEQGQRGQMLSQGDGDMTLYLVPTYLLLGRSGTTERADSR